MLLKKKQINNIYNLKYVYWAKFFLKPYNNKMQQFRQRETAITH